jgi:Rab-GTPase-TBC domain
MQGINYIAALFLLYMTEEEAFWMLVRWHKCTATCNAMLVTNNSSIDMPLLCSHAHAPRAEP